MASICFLLPLLFPAEGTCVEFEVAVFFSFFSLAEREEMKRDKFGQTKRAGWDR